jgi:hypothetical protein
MKEMRALNILAVVWLSLLLCCCEERGVPESGNVTLQLLFDTAQNAEPTDAVVKVLFMSNDGVVYNYERRIDEPMTFDLASGIYNITARIKYSADNVVHLYSGQLSEVILKDGVRESYNVPMSYSKTGQLIISEIYFSGCIGASGTKYFDDQYLILHNNSADTVYLDGVCVAFISPMRASSKSAFVDYYTDRTVAYNFLWSFPGSGAEHPLAPGADVVIAPNCVNHIALGNEASVDLSKEGYWACYDVNANLTKQSPPSTPDKKMLSLIWRNGSATACTCSVLDPAFVVFKIKGDVATYINEYSCFNPQQPNSSQLYLGVPYKWVYDAVECFDTTNRYKRLSSVADGGYALLSNGSGSAMSVHRKIDEAASAEMGFAVYQDSNNSSEDFEVCYPPSLKK